MDFKFFVITQLLTNFIMNDSTKNNNSQQKKITVNSDACIGCGICVSLAPEVFQMNEENKSEIKNPEGKNLTEAVNACPVAAIIINDKFLND
jgi:ferredoxin